MNLDSPLIQHNTFFLRQGLALLEELGDADYAARPPRGMSSIGAHLRHCLDLYTCFLAGFAQGRVDYDDRGRDPLLESDRQTAIRMVASLVERLESETITDFDQRLLVAMDRGDGEVGEEAFALSSVRRELQFLRSHTVHHYALIAAVLRALDLPVPADFGVAPATLTYRKRQAGNAVSAARA